MNNYSCSKSSVTLAGTGARDGGAAVFLFTFSRTLVARRADGTAVRGVAPLAPAGVDA